MLDSLKKDIAIKQKKGIHFIYSSVLLWGLITLVNALNINVNIKNLSIFCVSALLIPTSLLFSKILKINFSVKNNKLGNLAIILSVNQVLYILMVMWAYKMVPNIMTMFYAIIFGAHLMPFGWLYESKPYYVFSIVIPIVSLVIGCMLSGLYVSLFVFIMEIIFAIILTKEVKK